MYFANANSCGSLKFRPINCKLSGRFLLDSCIGMDTAGTPKQKKHTIQTYIKVNLKNVQNNYYLPYCMVVYKNLEKHIDLCLFSV